VAHFDRAIPPGGAGKINLTINLRGYDGPFWKSANVYTNDPNNATVTLNLRGRAKPVVEFRPAPVIEFRGKGEGALEKSLEIFASVQAFRILKVENPMKDRLTCHLETVIPGKHYRLKIALLQKKERFSGLVKCLTDLPQKPEILIPVYYNPDN
jgi:hypothetical protein